MSYLLTLLLFVLWLGVFASLMREGLWSNTLSLLNLLTAAVVATGFFQMAADWLEGMWPISRMFCDLVMIWGLFGLVFLILRSTTDAVSKTRMRFKPPIDSVGGGLMAAVVGWVFLCFTAATLHTAPLSRDFMYGGFRAEDPIFLGTNPDRMWLGFVQQASLGSLSRMASEDDPERYVFDRDSTLMLRYATRREEYSRTKTFSGDK